jgi:hypothetical protein
MEPYSYEPANRRRANGPGVRVFGSKMAESLESHANAVAGRVPRLSKKRPRRRIFDLNGETKIANTKHISANIASIYVIPSPHQRG